ncbi:uncharacterized protein LOC117338778 [Pecten maximus]|uniref:uncharacterized protein LOC117338778 n=1 Tax=Pecten maximus TaxID=6579 RepID=UPI0014580CCE|nr:uncharacterized protein LOC117338778 [Pecten maximus]
MENCLLWCKRTRTIYCLVLGLTLVVNCVLMSLLNSHVMSFLPVEHVVTSIKSGITADIHQVETNHDLLLNSIPKTFTSGYMVYTCNNESSVQCGGWSDRLSGILSTFVIALLTKQRFLIHHNHSFLLEEFLAPNEYDWRYNASISQKGNKANYDLMNKDSKKAKKYLYGKKDLDKYFKSYVNLIHINWDFTEVFRARPHIGRDVPWITKWHYADIYKEVYNYLFKPSERLSRALNSQKRRRSKTACAHVRIGKSENLPDDPPRHRESLDTLWNVFDDLDEDVYDLFIATDDESLLKRASGRYPNQIIETDGQIGHIAKLKKGYNTEVSLKMFLDFYMLINCDILILTESGFGMAAAYIRNTDSDLYCWRGPELKPCSRYTVHHMYEGMMLAPPGLFPHITQISDKNKRKAL